MSATGFALGNVASSVALVLVNKKVFAGGFHYPMSLSFFHFIFTVIWYQLLAVVGQYTPPPSGSDMPTGEKFKVALAGFASIGFMNLSLNTNSVGFYQITKLTIIPVTLVINAVAYGVHANAKIKIALSILLLGVGVATVTDVDLRPVGMLFGLLAVLTTAVFQIWQGTKQKEFGISATQLQAGIAAWQTAQAFAVAAATEMYCYTTPADGSNDVKNDDGPGGAAHVSRVAIACGRARGRADLQRPMPFITGILGKTPRCWIWVRGDPQSSWRV